MFGTIFTYHLEKHVPTLNRLQISFGKSKSHGSVSQLLALMSQLTVRSTKHFQYINPVMCLRTFLQTTIKFMLYVCEMLQELFSFHVCFWSLMVMCHCMARLIDLSCKETVHPTWTGIY